MSDLNSFITAFTEAAAPELRRAIYGGNPDEDRFQREFEYQLEHRGFSVGEEEDDG